MVRGSSTCRSSRNPSTTRPDSCTTGSTSNTVPLSVGSYYYLVSGTAIGTAGGLYTIASALAPIPEPETYVLMLAGLGAIGFVAARRRPRV